ncbi:hypothetical protein CB1_001183003 [Camelus ferus]|nr:hypothetical protein CB1_001183003 [Camelus ferus]
MPPKSSSSCPGLDRIATPRRKGQVGAGGFVAAVAAVAFAELPLRGTVTVWRAGDSSRGSLRVAVFQVQAFLAPGKGQLTVFASEGRRIIGTVVQEKGIEKGQILSSAADIAAAVQHTIACHIAKRTHRAILFCKQRDLLCQSNAVLVVSGGVASNLYIRKALEIVTDATQCTLLCPPPRLCTDNGIMIAWNGVERLRAGLGILHNTEGIRYEPKYVVPFIIFMQFAFESQSLDFAFICEVFIDILVILEEGLH